MVNCQDHIYTRELHDGAHSKWSYTEPAQLAATYMYKLIQRRQRIPTRLAGEVNSCVSCVCADLRWKSSLEYLESQLVLSPISPFN